MFKGTDIVVVDGIIGEFSLLKNIMKSNSKVYYATTDEIGLWRNRPEDEANSQTDQSS